MVVPSPLGWEPIPARPRRASHWILAALFALLAAVFVLTRITVPYYALEPGDALAVNGPQGPTTVNSSHSGSGRILLTTVSVQYRVTEFDRLTAFAHPDNLLVKREVLTGGQTTAQFAAANQQEMNDSQLEAKVAALRRLGYTITAHSDGALVDQVDPGTPGAATFLPGDVIVNVDGHAVTNVSGATTWLHAHKPGETVQVDIRRPSPPQAGQARPAPPVTKHVTVATITCPATICQTPNTPFIGIGLKTDAIYTLPASPDVQIQTDNIGGPSAGLSFALGVIDALTTGDLTGGHRVGVTGTVDVNGKVGPIGGIDQKTVAVERAHCDYFLVPPDEYKAAVAKAKGHHLTVIGVATLDQALTALGRIGGNLHGIPVKSPLPAA